MKKLESLQSNTKELLIQLSNLQMMQSFVFVGGSALAVYLNHRLSEDDSIKHLNPKYKIQ